MEHKIKQWLLKRGLNEGVIVSSGIRWNGNDIVIPVFDENQKHIFNKYRRNPYNSEGPKYKYDTGSSVALYNLHTLKENNGPIFICEGELDCLLLNTHGLTAVTSTGGSSSFNKEWVKYFEGRQTYIVFDRDNAGYKGAMKVQRMIPHAEIVILPDDFEGNDITDYFQTHTLKDFLSLDAKTYPIPNEPSGLPKTKKEMAKIVKQFSDASDRLLEMETEATQSRKPVRHIKIFQEYATSRYHSYKRVLDNFNRKFEGGDFDVDKAKQVPITDVLEFNYDNFRKCIWHEEKTGSMKYNSFDSKYPNTVKCFGCGMMSDVIGVVMQYHNLDFQSAVEFLTGKNYGN